VVGGCNSLQQMVPPVRDETHASAQLATLGRGFLLADVGSSGLGTPLSAACNCHRHWSLGRILLEFKL
jgi:hypothetical protein